MREAGDVCYADVFRDGTGVVEFVRKEDMTYAVRKLDNTKFRSHEVGFSFYFRLLDSVNFFFCLFLFNICNAWLRVLMHHSCVDFVIILLEACLS